MICPICENIEETMQSCGNCDWTFKYVTQEPTDEEKKVYSKQIEDRRRQYLNLLLNSKEEYEFLTNELLVRGEFQKTDEHRKQVDEKGFLKIGTIEYIDYDPDIEELKIKLHYEAPVEKSKFAIDISNFEINFMMKRDEAKIIFNDSKNYPLLARIDWVKNEIVYIDVKFLHYNLLKNIHHIDKMKKLGNASHIALGLGAAAGVIGAAVTFPVTAAILGVGGVIIYFKK